MVRRPWDDVNAKHQPENGSDSDCRKWQCEEDNANQKDGDGDGRWTKGREGQVDEAYMSEQQVLV